MVWFHQSSSGTQVGVQWNPACQTGYKSNLIFCQIAWPAPQQPAMLTDSKLVTPWFPGAEVALPCELPWGLWLQWVCQPDCPGVMAPFTLMENFGLHSKLEGNKITKELNPPQNEITFLCTALIVMDLPEKPESASEQSSFRPVKCHAPCVTLAFGKICQACPRLR